MNDKMTIYDYIPLEIYKAEHKLSMWMYENGYKDWVLGNSMARSTKHAKHIEKALRDAFRAGAAYAVGSHVMMVQTHPNEDQYIQQVLGNEE